MCTRYLTYVLPVKSREANLLDHAFFVSLPDLRSNLILEAENLSFLLIRWRHITSPNDTGQPNRHV